MKLLGVQLGNKEIDDVIETFAAAELELREIAVRKKDEAAAARDAAERLTQLANFRAGEVSLALSMASRLKLMLGLEPDGKAT